MVIKEAGKYESLYSLDKLGVEDLEEVQNGSNKYPGKCEVSCVQMGIKSRRRTPGKQRLNKP